MEGEIWKPVAGFLNIYMVSNFGRVRNICPPRGNGLLFGEIDRYGYRAVNLTKDGKKIKRRVHRLVCEAFHGPSPSPAHEVCHRDGRSLNNHADNLMWGTRSENILQAVEHGTHKAGQPSIEARRRGSAHPSAKLTEELVVEARRRFAAGETGKALAREFGVTQANMSNAIRGATWSHVRGSEFAQKEQG